MAAAASSSSAAAAAASVAVSNLGLSRDEEYVPFVCQVHRDLHPLRHDATIVQNSEFDTLRLMRNTLDGKNSLLQGEGGSSKTRSTLRLLLALHRAGKTFAMCATTGAACAAFTANALETLERWRKRADWGRRCGIAGLRKRGGGGGHKQEAAAAAAPEGKSSATDALYASVAARKHKRKHTSIAAAVAAAPAAAAADGDDSARAEQQLITKLSSCQTVHSFAGIGAKTTLAGLTAKLDKYQETNPGKVPKALQKLLHTDVMLLDEVSMAGVSMLRKADLHFRRARALIDPRNADLPLGGVQVVLIGDFLQIPPVADHFAFEWEHWAALDLQCVYMTHVWRQAGDVEYGRFLKRLRCGVSNEADIGMLVERAAKGYVPPPQGSDRLRPVHLVPYIKQVSEINTSEFAKLEGPVLEHCDAVDALLERVVGAGGRVDFVQTNAMSMADALKAVGKVLEMRVPAVLEFKEGAAYILTRNISVENGQVNGASCVCERDHDDDLVAAAAAGAPVLAAAAGVQAIPMVLYMRFRNGTRVRLSELPITELQQVFGRPNIYLRRKQYALRLGYAATFHGCQGATYDEAVIDLTSVPFAAAAYVGLGRVRTWANVHLLGFNATSLRTHRKALLVSTRLLAAYRASHAIAIPAGEEEEDEEEDEKKEDLPAPEASSSSRRSSRSSSRAFTRYNFESDTEGEEDERPSKRQRKTAPRKTNKKKRVAAEEDED